MSTTLVSGSLGLRFPFPDVSPVTDKAAEDLQIEEEVEKDLEEKIGGGGGHKMDILEKITVENTRDSLAEDLLSSLSKAPGKIVEPFVGPYINESPALNQRKHAPACKDPSSSTSADQLSAPIDPSKSSVNEYPAISQPEHNPAAGDLPLPTSADQDPLASQLIPPIDPSKSSASLDPAVFFQGFKEFLETRKYLS